MVAFPVVFFDGLFRTADDSKAGHAQCDLLPSFPQELSYGGDFPVAAYHVLELSEERSVLVLLKPHCCVGFVIRLLLSVLVELSQFCCAEAAAWDFASKDSFCCSENLSVGRYSTELRALHVFS